MEGARHFTSSKHRFYSYLLAFASERLTHQTSLSPSWADSPVWYTPLSSAQAQSPGSWAWSPSSNPRRPVMRRAPSDPTKMSGTDRKKEWEREKERIRWSNTWKTEHRPEKKKKERPFKWQDARPEMLIESSELAERLRSRHAANPHRKETKWAQAYVNTRPETLTSCLALPSAVPRKLERSVQFHLYGSLNNRHCHKAALQISGCRFSSIMSKPEATVERFKLFKS